ncbi:MAG: chemotaxis protein CheB [Erythrobacter sp.]
MSEFQYPIVAVGASAGGIEALKNLVECLSEDLKASFIVLQHLAPDHDSQLVHILERSCKLPCLEADEDMNVEPGHIYVLPPDRYMKIVDHGLFVEEPSDPRGKRMPIDYFMRSLADAVGSQAVGVILSGTGTDGTLGLRAIKGAGGLTFAQSPETALYDGMPRAAIEADHADRVGSIGEICEGISSFAQQSKEDQNTNFKRADLQAVLALIKARGNYDFGPYKSGTISRRVRRRMNLLRFDTLAEYVEHLRNDANELSRLASDLLINVTSFFRDREVWEDVSRKVITKIAAESDDEPIRVWVPACSSGEEAYTLAILFDEHCKRGEVECDWQIFATDLDEDAILTGREALYPASISGDVSEERLARYFDKEANSYRVKKSLREKVVFAHQNILSDPPFSRLDFISCRNLLIYLDSLHQKGLIETFHFALKEGGFLALGTSESVAANSRLFKTVSTKTHIYQRKKGPSTARLPSATAEENEATQISRFLNRSKVRRPEDLGQKVRRSLIERYAPAGVVIDRGGHIEHYSGKVRRYIETPEGKPTNNLHEMLPTAMRARVRKALDQADKGKVEGETATKIRIEDRHVWVRIDCKRFPADAEGGEPQYLLTFVETPEPRKVGDASEMAALEDQERDESSEHIRQLEHEIEIAREDLQTTVEELETSNEELKASHEEAMASNEELQSANEELETSREELQSLNEELVTVNHQLEDKVGEVEKSTDDLRNLLASTRLPVLFLDPKLNISSFTGTMRGLIELRDADVGRPLSDLAMKIDDPHLLEDAKSVLSDLQPVEREVGAERDQIYLRRVQPYRTSDERIGGVVATFTDISEKARTLRELEARERQASILSELGQKALKARDKETFLDEVCGSLRQALNCDYTKFLRFDADSKMFDLVAGAGWNPGTVGSARVGSERRSQAGFTLREQGTILVQDAELERRFEPPALLKDHDVRSGISTTIRLGNEKWGVLGLHDREPNHFSERDAHIIDAVANIVAMTLIQLEREQFLARERLSLSLAMGVANMGMWTYEPQSGSVTWDERLRTMTGLDTKKSEPQVSDFMMHIHREDRERVDQELRDTLDGRGPFDSEFRFVRPDGETIWLEGRGGVMQDPNGRKTLIGINVDATARKAAQDQTDFIMRELDHRVKNLLAVILSICRITSKTADSVEEFTEAFSARLDAMARTHSLLAQSRWNGTNLRTLLREELGSHDNAGQVAIEGPEVTVSPSAAQSLSMLFHELTTNAMKHGALSVPEGSIEVSWKRLDEIDDSVELRWIETGGPATSRPKRKGFGSKVIDRLARAQLNSKIETSWEKSGVQVKLVLPTHGLAKSPPPVGDTRKLASTVPHQVLEGKSILVLDDEWLIAEQHADIVSTAGANVVGPYLTLDEAMKVDPATLDLAILDFALEDSDVLPLADKLNEAGVPIVFVSGYGSNMKLPDQYEDDLVVAKPAGASAVLDSAAWLAARNSGAN